MKTTTASTTTKGKKAVPKKASTKRVSSKSAAKNPTTKKTRQTGNKPALKKEKASKAKVPGTKKPAAAIVKKAKPAQAKMLFKQGDLVVHENGTIFKVVKPPYAKKTVITIDAVEQRGGKNLGESLAIPVSKFVRLAKAGEQSATPTPTKKPTAKKSPVKNQDANGKKPTVASAMRALFAEHGLEATYAQAETAARQAKPDTKFAKSHWAWYRAQHKKTVAAGEGAAK
jgi:hypothetical protein